MYRIPAKTRFKLVFAPTTYSVYKAGEVDYITVFGCNIDLHDVFVKHGITDKWTDKQTDGLITIYNPMIESNISAGA